MLRDENGDGIGSRGDVEAVLGKAQQEIRTGQRPAAQFVEVAGINTDAEAGVA
jgi:hypothetical protein